MRTSELIDHVSLTTMTDAARITTVMKGRAISPPGRVDFTRFSRAARHHRIPCLVAFSASVGVRFAPGSPRAAALNAKSGARKAASAKAAKGPVDMVESVKLR